MAPNRTANFGSTSHILSRYLDKYCIWGMESTLAHLLESQRYCKSNRYYPIIVLVGSYNHARVKAVVLILLTSQNHMGLYYCQITSMEDMYLKESFMFHEILSMLHHMKFCQCYIILLKGHIKYIWLTLGAKCQFNIQSYYVCLSMKVYSATWEQSTVVSVFLTHTDSAHWDFFIFSVEDVW